MFNCKSWVLLLFRVVFLVGWLGFFRSPMSLNYSYSHSTSNREGCSFLSLLLYALLLCPCFGAIYSNTSWWLLGFFFLDATNILQKIVSFLPLNIQLSFICKSWLFCSSWYCFHLCFGVSQSQCCKIKLLFLFSYAVSSYLDGSFDEHTYTDHLLVLYLFINWVLYSWVSLFCCKRFDAKVGCNCIFCSYCLISSVGVQPSYVSSSL